MCSNETYQYKGQEFSLSDIEYSVCHECGFDLVLSHQTRRNEARVRGEHRRIDLLRRSKVEMPRVAHEVLVRETETSQRCEGPPRPFLDTPVGRGRASSPWAFQPA